MILIKYRCTNAVVLPAEINNIILRWYEYEVTLSESFSVVWTLGHALSKSDTFHLKILITCKPGMVQAHGATIVSPSSGCSSQCPLAFTGNDHHQFTE